MEARRSPDAIALTETSGREISRGALADRVRSFVYHLQQEGFKSGERALIMIRPGVDQIVAIFSLVLLGGVIVVAEPGMSQELFDIRMNEIQPSWLFAESALLALPYHPVARGLVTWLGRGVVDVSRMPKIRVIRRGPWIPGSMSAISFAALSRDASGGNCIPHVARPDEDLLVVFTSGTTTDPKMVVHSLRSVTVMLNTIRTICSPRPDDIFYTPLPHFLLLAATIGVHAVIPPMNTSVSRRLADIHRHQPTMLFGAPVEFLEIAELLSKQGNQLPVLVRKILIGSAPVTRAFLERFLKSVHPSTEVTCIYGMTEILPVSTVDARIKAATPVDGDLLGMPVSGIRTEIASDGELRVSGPHLFDRYWGSPKASCVDSGDLVRESHLGLVLMGRKKDMIIRRDVNIYPPLFEASIERIPGVRACALVGVFDEVRQDETVVLVVEPDAGVDPELLVSRVRREVESGRSRVDAGAVPDRYFAEELPRVGRQRKIDKRTLREVLSKRVI